jgi:hypothetical protein
VRKQNPASSESRRSLKDLKELNNDIHRFNLILLGEVAEANISKFISKDLLRVETNSGKFRKVRCKDCSPDGRVCESCALDLNMEKKAG